MVIRLSQKLASKLKVGNIPPMPLDSNEYADWSAHLFTVARTQYIILCNTKSLYCCFMYGRGITHDCIFVEQALNTIREFMADDGLSFCYRKYVAPSSSTVLFAKSLSRTVTGSMNDHVQGAKILLKSKFSSHDLGLRLNKTPLSALTDADGKKYASPNTAFKLLRSDA